MTTNAQAASWQGVLVRHLTYGLGKVLSIENGRPRVRFISPEVEHTFGAQALGNRTLVRHRLNPGTRCQARGGTCTISRIESDTPTHSPFKYEVLFDDGLRGIATEVELDPLPRDVSTDPVQELATLEQKGYSLFEAREKLQDALSRLWRDGAGLTAMLSARIDLRPHQAYVAGVVLRDHRRRYILADEVGLGKTIEAGIVIHDVLSKNPAGKVLVVCPGALTQQWLCELYSKFGGQVFRLLDLHSESALRSMELRTSIVSMSLAVRGVAEKLLNVDWDMVVVDEAHHLLTSPSLYRLVQDLSRRAPSVLLLSALPAQRREDEFLQLLALLEPGRFTCLDDESRRSFQELYDAQRQIGRRLRIYSRRLEALEDGEGEPGRVVEVARRFLESPLLSADQELVSAVDALDPEGAGFIPAARELRHRIAEGYRINRRILRNRRARLIDEGEIEIVRRVFVPLVYTPGQPELDSIEATERLVRSALEAGAAAETVNPFARLAFQALSAPESIQDLLARLDEVPLAELNAPELDLLAIGQMIGYSDWKAYVKVAATAIKRFVDQTDVATAIARARLWKLAQSRDTRMEALVAYLRELSRKRPRLKVLVFAGYPGRASVLADRLRREFDRYEVAEFRHDLSPEAKEDGAQRFRTNDATWLLVSDETGGEGRNFQFANEIIHVDTPWNAARVEQRIGRLDRLGRERTRGDVRSVVLHCPAAPEGGLVHCYNEGLGVYQQSISGIEFGLRQIEDRIAGECITGGVEALIEATPEIRAAAEEERARDDGDAVLDEGSFNREAAERFHRVGRAQASEKSVEEAFVRFLQCTASARTFHDNRFATGIWKFSTESRFGPLPDLEKDGSEGTGSVIGTFRRDIAQLRPDLQFFSVGNPFFEAVVASLDSRITGRSYAIACTASGQATWIGFEFVFKAVPCFDAIDDPGLLGRIIESFPSRKESIFVDTDGNLVTDGGGIAALRRSLAKEQKGRTWCNLTHERAAVIPDFVPTGWQDSLNSAYELASTAGREIMSDRLAPELDEERRRIEGALEEALSRQEGERTADIQALKAISRAMENWSLRLDAVGFLAVNAAVDVI